jgi:hypothetical protein
VVLGTGNPTDIVNAMTTNSIQNGLVGRLLLFEGLGFVPMVLAPDVEPPAELIERAKWWGDQGAGGNLSNLAQSTPSPRVVPMTGEAREILLALIARADAAMQKWGEPLGVVFGRTAEAAVKLALIYACSANHLEPVIDAAAMQWGSRIAEYSSQRLAHLAHWHVSDSVFSGLRKKILLAIEAAGANGITAARLTRRFQDDDPILRPKALAVLCEGGLVVPVPHKPVRGPSTFVYFAARHARGICQ